MAAGNYTFIIEQGATTDFEIVWKDSTGSPVDLSNYHARMQVRSDYGSTGTLYATLSSSLDSDGTGLNFSGSSGTNSPTEGTIGVFISDTNTAAMDFSKAVYDLEIVSASIVTRLLEGKVTLNPEVTIIP